MFKNGCSAVWPLHLLFFWRWSISWCTSNWTSSCQQLDLRCCKRVECQHLQTSLPAAWAKKQPRASCKMKLLAMFFCWLSSLANGMGKRPNYTKRYQKILDDIRLGSQQRSQGAYLHNFFPQTFLQKVIEKNLPNSQLLQGTVATEASLGHQMGRWTHCGSGECQMNQRNLGDILCSLIFGKLNSCTYVRKKEQHGTTISGQKASKLYQWLQSNFEEWTCFFYCFFLLNSDENSPRSGSLWALIWDPFGNDLDWLKVDSVGDGKSRQCLGWNIPIAVFLCRNRRWRRPIA